MRRIVFLTPSMKTGGGNRVFVELSNRLCNQHHVSILYPNNSNEGNTFYIDERIKIRSIGSYSNSPFLKIWNLFLLIFYVNRCHKNDIVVFTDPIFSVLSFLIKAKDKYRFIQADDYRIFDDGCVLQKKIYIDIYKVLCKISYGFDCKFIFNSKYVYDQYLNVSKRSDVPYHLVHPSFDSSVFNANRITGASKGITICLVARKHPWKGFSDFIKAFKSLDYVTKHTINEVIVVSHDDLKDFSLDGMSIVVPKSDRDIAQAYKRADIFISTSWWEGFGLPPLEAMACGCAVLLSDAGGVNEYALPGFNCLMYQPKDVKGLREKLEEVIMQDDIRKSISQNALSVHNRFSWDISARQFLDVIS